MTFLRRVREEMLDEWEAGRVEVVRRLYWWLLLDTVLVVRQQIWQRLVQTVAVGRMQFIKVAIAFQAESKTLLEGSLAHQVLHVKWFVVRKESSVPIDHFVETLTGNQFNLPVSHQLALPLHVDFPEAHVGQADVFVIVEGVQILKHESREVISDPIFLREDER